MEKQATDVTEKRAHARQGVIQTAILEYDGRRIECLVVNLSNRGAKIRTPKILRYKNSFVKLHVSEIGMFDAEIRWTNDCDVGLCLADEVGSLEDKDSATIQDVLRVCGES